MKLDELGSFASSIGLIKSSCRLVASEFLRWQEDILKPWGFKIEVETVDSTLSQALAKLKPRTSPIITKYLFWPLADNWTMYIDNGVHGSDASPPSVLATRLDVDAVRVVMCLDDLPAGNTRNATFYANILEYYRGNKEIRHIFASNDGGVWRFGQSGEPFSFENTEAYKSRSIRNRFTASMLLEYLSNLGIDLQSEDFGGRDGSGYVLKKQGKMPANFCEHND